MRIYITLFAFFFAVTSISFHLIFGEKSGLSSEHTLFICMASSHALAAGIVFATRRSGIAIHFIYLLTFLISPFLRYTTKRDIEDFIIDSYVKLVQEHSPRVERLQFLFHVAEGLIGSESLSKREPKSSLIRRIPISQRTTTFSLSECIFSTYRAIISMVARKIFRLSVKEMNDMIDLVISRGKKKNQNRWKSLWIFFIDTLFERKGRRS